MKTKTEFPSRIDVRVSDALMIRIEGIAEQSRRGISEVVRLLLAEAVKGRKRI